MKKRLISLTLACALVSLILCGCQPNEDEPSQAQTPDKPYESSVSEEPSVIPTTANEFASLSTQKQGWGQGVQFDDQNCPISCTNFQNKYGQYDALFIKESCPSQLFLTFDEGYENGYTAQILDILKENEVPAVFFVTSDYVEQNPDLIQRMIDEGHVVGNHTDNHPSMPTLTPEKMESEVMALDEMVSQQYNYEMTLFRPPMGEFSEQSLAVTQSLGYKTVFWSFAYNDWDPDSQPDPDAALQKLTDRLHDGAIYLLHAVSQSNTEILDSFIKQTKEQGYTFEVLK